MKLDRITGITENHSQHLKGFCTNPACAPGAVGRRVTEQPEGCQKLPEDVHLYECLRCQHRFEVQHPSSVRAEVALVVSPRTASITVPCPRCGHRCEYKAANWGMAMPGGVFPVAPHADYEKAYWVDCSGCHAMYVIRPQYDEAHKSVIENLSALVRQLAYRLSGAAPDSDLPAKALDYLKREGLQGSPLRSADEQ